jgi:hypothetical protein
MQQAAILSGDNNPIDNVSNYYMEILNINDVNHTTLTLESLS